MACVASLQPAFRRTLGCQRSRPPAPGPAAWPAADIRIRRLAAAAPAPGRRTGSVRVAAEAGPSAGPSADPSSSELAEYIAYSRTAEAVSSIQGEMTGLQLQLDEQLAAVEAIQASLRALEGRPGGTGGTPSAARRAAEAAVYAALGGGEAERLRRELAQQSAAVDGTLAEMRTLESQLSEAKAVRTTAYAAKVAALAADVVAKHSAKLLPGAPASAYAQAAAEIQSDVLRLGRLAVGVRLSDDLLEKQHSVAQSMADEWRCHAAGLRLSGEAALAAEGFARAGAFGERAAALASQQRRLGEAVEAVRGSMRALEEALEDARAARDAARASEAATAAAAAGAAAGGALASGCPLEMEAALRDLRRATLDAAASRQALVDRHAAAASQAEHWHQQWLRNAQMVWTDGAEEAEAHAEACQQRRQPYADRAATLLRQLGASGEGASSLMLSLRITETRLAEALAAAAAAQAAERADGSSS